MDLRRATGQEADRFIRAISPGVSGIPDCIAAAAAVMATVAAMMGSRWSVHFILHRNPVHCQQISSALLVHC